MTFGRAHLLDKVDVSQDGDAFRKAFGAANILCDEAFGSTYDCARCFPPRSWQLPAPHDRCAMWYALDFLGIGDANTACLQGFNRRRLVHIDVKHTLILGVVPPEREATAKTSSSIVLHRGDREVTPQ